jgi:hypothetical protein
MAAVFTAVQLFRLDAIWVVAGGLPVWGLVMAFGI